MSDEIDNKDVDKKEPQPDMAQAELISFYSDAPISGPASFQEAAQSKANFSQRLPGTSEWTIGNGVGSLGQLTREEIAEKEKEESAELFEEFSEAVEHIREQEREREEWAQAKHKYAGLEMTGEEWGEFAEQLKGDTPLRKWLLSQMKKDGKTDAQAKDLTDLVALRAEMQKIPESQWNDEQRALDAKLKANPVLSKEVEDYTARANEHAKMNLNVDVNKPAIIASSGMELSTDAGADILAQPVISTEAALVPASKSKSFAASMDEPTFPKAPDLSEHHRAALAATEPLDAPKQLAALTPPPTPTPPPGGGFDV